MSEIIEVSQTKNLPLWKVILEDDVLERKVTEKESFSRMEKMLDAMLEADKKYDPNLRSQSGLSGGDGARLETFRKKENRLIGTFLAMVMEKAVKMAESNACMGRIVAAPTAGSCGVIPAVLLTYLEEKNVEKTRVVEALFCCSRNWPGDCRNRKYIWCGRRLPGGNWKCQFNGCWCINLS